MSTATPPRDRLQAGPSGAVHGSGGATHRTLLALLASGLAALPLKDLFYDSGWLIDVWLAMIVVVGPAALIRIRRPAGALDIWPGVILLVPWLTVRYVGGHAWFGVIPNGRTLDDVSALMTDLHHTTSDQTAPIHTTLAVRLVLCALLGLLAALVDLIAVVGRRGALAGVPLLVVYTVAGAVPRKPVAWEWFAFAAVGFLILLALDAGDDLAKWGKRVHASGGSRSRTALAVSAQRIAAAAIVAAIVLPALVPDQSRNLISDAFHHSGTGLGGFGGGNGNGGSISPFAALKGYLDRRNPVDLATVHVDRASAGSPYNLRANVLTRYTAQGFSGDGHGDTEDVTNTDFGTDPVSNRDPRASRRVTIVISGMVGNAPVLTLPDSVSGVSAGSSWSPRDQLLLGSNVHRGQQIVEDYTQPSPSVDELRRATADPGSALAPMLEVPSSFPAYARDLDRRITQNATTPYDRARALNDYFTQPANGFSYSLDARQGDSGSALVDFLKNKTGYCQQYAAAMAIMLREVNVPSRVVLGYMHPAPDAKGNFKVTTADAHAWVEAYFEGIGWIPFDPTPVDGLVGGAKTDLTWAPHPYPSDSSAAASSAAQSSGPAVVKPRTTDPTSTSRQGATAAHSSPTSPLPWVLLGIVVAAGLGLVPAATRMLRRRRRYQYARREGASDPLWAELSDTAVDLGYVWSPARSPRQVVDWLARDTRSSSASLNALAVAVEHSRYSPDAHRVDGAELAGDLRAVTAELRAMRSGRIRLAARLWPASLGWGARSPRLRRR